MQREYTISSILREEKRNLKILEILGSYATVEKDCRFVGCYIFNSDDYIFIYYLNDTVLYEYEKGITSMSWKHMFTTPDILKITKLVKSLITGKRKNSSGWYNGCVVNK